MKHALAPIYFLGSTDFTRQLTFMQKVGIIDMAANILIVILLWRRKPIVLRALKFYFVAFFTVSGVSLILLILASSTNSSGENWNTQDSISHLLVAILYQLAWYLYFVRSKRVLSTYGRNI